MEYTRISLTSLNAATALFTWDGSSPARKLGRAEMRSRRYDRARRDEDDMLDRTDNTSRDKEEREGGSTAC